MRSAKHDHQSRHQPSGHEPNLLHQALLYPEEELIGFLQQSPRRHHASPPAMPAEVALLLFDGLLEHGLQPTISAGPRRAACFSSRRITQRAPAARGRYQMHLAVERPLPPMLLDAVAHDHLRDVLIRALMHSIRPTL